MRWELLFGDIEAQLEEARRLEREADAVELERGEHARIAFLERLRGSDGCAISVVLSGVGRLEGVVERVGNGWLVLKEGPADWLLSADAIRAVSGVPRTIPPEGSLPWKRLGLGSALRAVSRDRALVRVFLQGGGPEVSPVSGVIARVGADFLELRETGMDGDARKFRAFQVIPFAGIAALQGGAAPGVFQSV